MSINEAKVAIMAMQSQPGGAGEASRWLATFEESSAAWQVAWDLVSIDEVGSQEAHMYRFFGAKMIYSKIQRDFEQLGEGEVPAFTQRLVARVIDMTQRYAYAEYFVVCRYMCLAIAAMALQVNREGVVSQILIWFNPILQSAPLVLLELLLVLPEESVNYHIDVDDDTRDRFAYQLTESFGDVANFLTQQSSSPSCPVETKVKAMRCLGAWIESTFVGGSLVASQPLFQTALGCLQSSDPDILEAAVDVVIATFQRFGSSNQDLLATCWPALLSMKTLWKEAVIKEDCEEGDPAYAVCRHVSRVVTEVCDACYRFLTALPADNNEVQEAAVHGSKVAMMELLLECCAHCEQDISTIPLTFLSNLVEDLTELYFTYKDALDDGYSPDSSQSSSSPPQRGGGAGFDEDSANGEEDYAKWTHCWTLYSPSLAALLKLCTRHCAYIAKNRMILAIQNKDNRATNTSVGELILDEEENDARKVWVKMATDVCELLDRVHGPNAPLVAVAQPLREAVDATATSDPAIIMKLACSGGADRGGHSNHHAHVVDAALQLTAKGNPAAYCVAYMEAHLVILATTLPFVEGNENNVLPWLFESLFLARIPGIDSHSAAIPQYCLSLTKAVGAAARWLCHGQQGQKYLPHALQTLSSCLNDPLYQLQAAQSLRDILSKCGTLPGALAEAMKIHALLVEARSAVGNGSGLPLQADLHLLQGICDVLSVFYRSIQTKEQQDELSSYVWAITQPMVTALTTAVNKAKGGADLPPVPPSGSSLQQRGDTLSPRAGDDPSGGSGVHSALDRLCVVLQHLHVSPDMYMALLQQQVLGLLQAVLDSLPHSYKLCERACRCYKHGLRNAGPAFSPLLQPLLAHLTQSFLRHHDGTFLYIIAVSIGEFGRSNRHDASTQPGPMFTEALCAVSTHFFTRLTSKEELEAAPDVVEEYFCLLQKCLQVAPALYFSFVEQASLGDRLYSAAVAALTLNHRDVHKGVLSFFLSLINAARQPTSSSINSQDGRQRRGGQESQETPETASASHAIQARAMELICGTVGAPLTSALLRVIYSADYKYALGGDTKKQCHVLLGLVRVLKTRASSAAQASELFSQWWEQGLVAVEAEAARAAANATTGSSNSGGRMKARTAVQKSHIVTVLLREEDEDAVEALYRSHTMVIGRQE